MTDHEHYFEMVYYTFKDGWPRALCRECGETIEETEVNRMLNEHVKLKRGTAHIRRQTTEPPIVQMCDILLAEVSDEVDDK